MEFIIHKIERYGSNLSEIFRSVLYSFIETVQRMFKYGDMRDTSLTY